MSYGFPPKPKTESATPRGGGFMMLILLAVGAYFAFSMFSSRVSSPDASSEPGIKRGQGEPLDASYADSGLDDAGKSNVGKDMPSVGRNRSAAGWDANDANSSAQTMPSSHTMPSNRTDKVTGLDDWAAEEVEIAPQKTEGIDLRFSNETPNQPQTSDSDWHLEEVPQKKSVTNGDWKAEPVGPRN